MAGRMTSSNRGGEIAIEWTAPRVALADAAVYRRLALLDALRLGSARERGLAADLLKKELGL